MAKKRSLTIFCYLLGFALTFCVASASAQVPIPPLKARVTDVAGMLKPDQRAALEKMLLTHEVETGNQVAILLMNHTAPEAIEQYSIRVAEAWKIGRKGIDDGVILIIAKNNTTFGHRRMRLEVGRGAEGVLTDAMSKRILQDIIVPYFRQDDFYGGLSAGVSAIYAVLKKEAFPAPPKQAVRNTSKDVWIGWFLALSFLLLVPIMIVANLVLGARSIGNMIQAAEDTRKHGTFIGPGWYIPWGSPRSSDVSNFSGGGSFGDGGGGGDFSGGGGGFGGGGASGDW